MTQCKKQTVRTVGQARFFGGGKNKKKMHFLYHSEHAQLGRNPLLPLLVEALELTFYRSAKTNIIFYETMLGRIWKTNNITHFFISLE
jgi:hypothetical protein